MLFASAADAASLSCTLVNHAIDTGTDNLDYVRLAARADGRPLIAYTTDVHNASTLNLFDCDDSTCASGHIVPLDVSSNYFGAPGITLGAFGGSEQVSLTALQSGLLFGYVGLVEGMVARFRKELGPDMKAIATGGLASVIAGQTTVIDHIAPWLTLDGLKIVWELNHK